MVSEGVGVPGVTKKMNQAGKKKAIICARLVSLTRHYQDLELLVCGGVQSPTGLLLFGVN